MKKVTPEETWPESWKYSYPYDLEEVYGQVSCHGYAYAYENRRCKTLALVEEVVPPGSRILDVAAAQGNFSLALAERGYRVTWNDLRADLVDYVKLKHEHGDITFAPGNVFELEFDHAFDCVVATEVIEHVAHPDEFLKKLSQMVRPGGYLVLTTPNGAYFRNDLPRFSECDDPSVFESVQFKPNADGHIFLLWPDELERLAEQAGWMLERRAVFTTPLTNGHVKLGIALRVLPRRVVFAVEGLASHLPLWLKHKLMVHAAARFRRD